MTRILLLGYAPETVDFSDPALPPVMTAEKVHAGIAVALKQFAERGWESDVCFIRPDDTRRRGRVVIWQKQRVTYCAPAPRLRSPEKCASARYRAANAAVRVRRRPQASEERRLGYPIIELPGADRRGTLASRIFRGRLSACSDGSRRAIGDTRASAGEIPRPTLVW